MATGSGAFSAKAGYNQSGGGYYIVITSLTPAQLLTYTPGTGSGGATTVGSFAGASTTEMPTNVSTLFGAGRICKDMGKTVVSAGRTFRKLQAIAPTDNALGSTFGVTGPAATATNPGYATYYVETGRDGANADASLPALARYF